MISMIWAMDENWLIGKDNLLPWHYKEDLIYFKNIVNQKIVLMGEQTYLSLKSYYKKKPLPYKKIYVCNLEDKTYDDAILVQDIHQFLKQNEEEIFVIGGKTIYQLALPYADQLYITYVLNRHEGNIYFPKFDLSNYKLAKKEVIPSLIFALYERVSS
ncbi:dihydrofolate reductase [Mycoplasmatota bacterium]|nr:dihydrofolate reductase [Mycoplasmatota bacterium]